MGYTSTNFIGKEIRDSEGKTVYIQFEFVDEEKTSRIFEPLDLNIIRKLIDNRHKSTYDPTLDGLIMRDLTIPDPKANSRNKLSVTPTTMKTSSTTTSTIIKVTDLDKNWKPDGTKGECGKRSVPEDEISAFLAGGVATELGAFPYMTILGYDSFVNKKNETKKNYNCGGSLINRWYVLTAAHF